MPPAPVIVTPPVPIIAAPTAAEPQPQIETLVREERIVETVRTAPPVPTERIEAEPPSLQPPAPERVVVTSEREITSIEERRIVEERREEQQLLHKADAFMGALLDRRPPPPAAEETQVEREIQILEPRPQHEAAPRLQPLTAQTPVHDAPPEPPSLVIGTLTVEVLPSAPAVAPQRPPVVIVRGGRGAGRPSFPSSRRFGMRQF